jgi:hypothetical protein
MRNVVPKHCLAHLRFIELVFPPYAPRHWDSLAHLAVPDWQSTVDWVRDKINAPALTIRVVMADFREVSPSRATLTVPQGNRILHGYERILRPLRCLVRDDALRGVYVQVAFPWRWTDDARVLIEHLGDDGLAKYERVVKGWCESIVYAPYTNVANIITIATIYTRRRPMILASGFVTKRPRPMYRISQATNQYMTPFRTAGATRAP